MGLHDMIQPSFTFLVGVALPYSIHSRMRKGQSFGKQLAHTVWRSVLLIALGIFLRSTGSSQTNFTFEDTLTQIGLGYTLAFLLAYCLPKMQWAALVAILFGYWLSLGALPRAGAELRLCGGWGARGLASQLQRLRLALEQEQQPGPGVRCLVLESAAASIALRLQRRRLSHAQFHSYAGHHTAWTPRGRMVSIRCAKNPHQALPDCRRAPRPDGPHAALHWNLPDRETHLDARLDALQRRCLLLLPRRILMDHRRQGAIADGPSHWSS